MKTTLNLIELFLKSNDSYKDCEVMEYCLKGDVIYIRYYKPYGFPTGSTITGSSDNEIYLELLDYLTFLHNLKES